MQTAKAPPIQAILTQAASLFVIMEIAEEAIADAKKAHPDNPVLDDAFRYLCPTAPLRGTHHALYRAHADEILTRVATGKPLAPATAAEILATLSGVSLKAPPGPDAAALQARLFRAIFPDAIPDDGRDTRESYPNAATELHAQLQKRITFHRDCAS